MPYRSVPLTPLLAVTALASSSCGSTCTDDRCPDEPGQLVRATDCDDASERFEALRYMQPLKDASLFEMERPRIRPFLSVDDDGKHAWLMTERSLQRVDISTPTSPSLLSTQELEGEPLAFRRAGARLLVVSRVTVDAGADVASRYGTQTSDIAARSKPFGNAVKLTILQLGPTTATIETERWIAGEFTHLFGGTERPHVVVQGPVAWENVPKLNQVSTPDGVTPLPADWSQHQDDDADGIDESCEMSGSSALADARLMTFERSGSTLRPLEAACTDFRFPTANDRAGLTHMVTADLNSGALHSGPILAGWQSLSFTPESFIAYPVAPCPTSGAHRFGQSDGTLGYTHSFEQNTIAVTEGGGWLLGVSRVENGAARAFVFNAASGQRHDSDTTWSSWGWQPSVGVSPRWGMWADYDEVASRYEVRAIVRTGSSVQVGEPVPFDFGPASKFLGLDDNTAIASFSDSVGIFRVDDEAKVTRLHAIRLALPDGGHAASALTSLGAGLIGITAAGPSGAALEIVRADATTGITSLGIVDLASELQCPERTCHVATPPAIAAAPGLILSVTPTTLRIHTTNPFELAATLPL